MTTGIDPEVMTAKRLAAQTGWSEARARHVLEGFLERGMVTVSPDGNGYLINGRGLAIGERMGVVVPFDDAVGYKLSSGNAADYIRNPRK